jgi:phosphatidylinositol alpha-1,6-mannosyltransferase
MAQPRDGVLGVFPGCIAPGGIQASGRLAWDAITSSAYPPGPRSLFCYGDAGPAGVPAPPNAFHTAAKPRAVLRALTMRDRFRLVLVWHMDLLKLLPFFRQRGARVVLILQGIEAWRRRPWPERNLLRQVNVFLSISDYTWQRFLQVYPEYADTRHHTVPLGIGAPWAGQTLAPGPTPAALMLSRLVKREDYKGHREMLDAWPLVLRQLPTAQLWIAGDGDLRPELERVAADRGLGRAVRFLGFVSEQHKHRLLEQARCMAVPSRGEGFGLVYLEAMRLGRPCLVSTLDAGREVVDPPRHGLAVDPGDPAGLAEAACRLMTIGPEWQQWSTSARERFEHHFSARHYQRRLLSTLASLDSSSV